MNLLRDNNTYIPSSSNIISKNIDIFNKSYKKKKKWFQMIVPIIGFFQVWKTIL